MSNTKANPFRQVWAAKPEAAEAISLAAVDASIGIQTLKTAPLRRSLFGGRAAAPLLPKDAALQNVIPAPTAKKLPATQTLPAVLPLLKRVAPSALAAPTNVAVVPPRVGNFLQVAEHASLDLRKACNSIKRMAAIASVAAELDIEIALVAEKAEALTLEVLTSLGYDATDSVRMGSAIPMVMEAVCVMLAESARNGDDPITNSGRIAPALVEIARSKFMARAIERSWPDDIDAGMAINISAVHALAPVSLEAMSFAFFQPIAPIMKEASQKLFATVQIAVDDRSPQGTSSSSKLMFTQSLLQSGGRVLAAVWRQVADELIEAINALPSDKRRARVGDLVAAAPQSALEPVITQFNAIFGAMLEATRPMDCNRCAMADAAVRDVATPVTLIPAPEVTTPRSVLTRRVAGRA